MTYEEQVLTDHSHPRLRKNELTRRAKKEHLDSLGVRGDDARKILDDLYNPTPTPKKKKSAQKTVKKKTTKKRIAT
jgi:hypothetical protein